MPEFDRYLSPYTWRYGSPEMRALWSEIEKRALWRKIWVALARVQAEFGLVTPEQVKDLEAHAGQVDIDRSLQIEAEIQHDLMAELKAFAEQSPQGGGIIHLGATSMDIEDNADALRIRASLDLVIRKLEALLKVFAEKITQYAATPLMAFTHIQPAEPSTLGYRLALYAQDLLGDLENLRYAHNHIKGKGFKGAVGTAASYGELIGLEQIDGFEQKLSQALELPFYPVSSQTYPRKQDYLVLCALSGLAASLYKFAFDLRLLQSPTIGELSEPFSEKQVGSSAMPFKRNPIHSEKIDSLARLLSQMPPVAWNNAAHSLLERTLDDSANRRTLLPEAFLISDELLKTATRLVSGLNVNLKGIERNLAVYAPFASTERVLMALVKSGANRQEMHEILRDSAMQAWADVRQGRPNPLVDLLSHDPALNLYLSPDEINRLMDVEGYTGIAPQRAQALAEEIRQALSPKPA